MKNLITFLAVLCLFASSALAQTPTPNPVTVNRLVGLGMRPELASFVSQLPLIKANSEWIAASNAAGSGTLYLLSADTSDNTRLNAATGKVINLTVAKTPVAVIGSTGFTTAPFAADATFLTGSAPRLAPYVPTMASTPVAGTNDLHIGVNAIPTAAANTAAIMPTPIAGGQELVAINLGANAVRLKAGGTNTINGSSGGGYVPLATQAVMRCRSLDSTSWQCGSEVVPTPAGP